MKILAPLMALALTLSACDSPSTLTSSRTQDNPVRLRANLIPASNAFGSASVLLPDLSPLPENLRSARQIDVIFDNSRSSVSATRNADGSLSFPLSTGRAFDSDSRLNVILVADQSISLPVSLETGLPLKLASTPFTVSPANTVTSGTRLTLKANTTESTSAYVFAWEFAPSAAGPWQALSGNGPEIEWDARQAGAYYIRLQLTDTRNGSVSEYISPAPLIYVQNATRIAQTEPKGAIVQGERILLKVALPEYQNNKSASFQWFYGNSAFGPFQSISSGSQVSWEPPAPGAYYLQLQVQDAGRLSSYTSSQAEVIVSSGDEQILTRPANGSVLRGENITLISALPESNAQLSWEYAFSPQGPFQAIAGSGREVSWQAPGTGEFYLRLRSIDPQTGTSKSYTSSKPKVFVRDSNERFSVTPSSLRKGDSVELTLNDAPSEQINWSYSTSPQGPFSPIAGGGSRLTWTPPVAGNYYLQASAIRPDGSTATFSSANTLVSVSERANVILTTPVLGNLNLGQAVRLRADISGPDLRYSWSYSSSAQGNFQPIISLDDATQREINWYPPQVGSYVVKVEISNPRTQSSVSFVSAEPVVRVEENTPFFSTNPSNGRIEPGDDIVIKTAFESGSRTFNFGWAYSTSTAGPFIPLGGSSLPEVRWEMANKPYGSYFIRLQATSPGSDRSLSFLSAYPVVFVSRDRDSGGSFGVSKITP